MDITKYFEGIRGEYVEFQITPRMAPQDKSEWLRQLDHWKKTLSFYGIPVIFPIQFLINSSGMAGGLASIKSTFNRPEN